MGNIRFFAFGFALFLGLLCQAQATVVDFTSWPVGTYHMPSIPGGFITDDPFTISSCTDFAGCEYVYPGHYVAANISGSSSVSVGFYTLSWASPGTNQVNFNLSNGTNVWVTGGGAVSYSATSPLTITSFSAYPGNTYTGVVSISYDGAGTGVLRTAPTFNTNVQTPVGTPGNSSCSTVDCAGQPVNLATGTLWHENVDFEIPSVTPETNLRFSRVYSSNPGLVTSGDLGFNWRHNFETSLWASGTNVIWIDEKGGAWTFALVSGSYVSPVGLRATLTKFSDHYELKKSNGTIYSFSLPGFLTSITEKHGASITLTYDSGGKLASVSAPLAGSITFTRDSAGRISTVTRSRDSLTYTYSYNSNGFLTSEQDFNGHTYTYAYSSPYSNSWLTGITDPLSHTTTFSYYLSGHYGWAYQQFEPGSATRTFYYDTSGSTPITYVTEVDGYTTTYKFDSNFRTTEIDFPNGTTRHKTWNSSGYLSSETDEAGGVTNYSYDSNGNLTSIQRPADSSAVAITYNTTFNQPTSMTPLAGGATTFTLDTSTGDIIGIGRGGLSLGLTRDSFGNIVSYNNGRTTYSDTRDSNGLLTYLYDTHNSESRAYDSRGRIHTRTFQTGRVLTYSYDDYDRITQVTDSNGPTITNTYDALGKLLTRTVGSGTSAQTTTYAYDARDRVTSITDPLGHATTYAYDATHIMDKPISITDAAGHATTFTYDTRHRITKTTDALGHDTLYSYDAKGDLASITDAAGNVTSYTYDGNNRKTSETRKSVAGTTAVNRVTNFAYDAGDRLISETTPSATGGSSRVVSYEYDNLDRLVHKVVGTSSAARSLLHKLAGGLGLDRFTLTVQDDSTYTYENQLDATLLLTANNGVENLTFTNEAARPFHGTSFQLAAAQTGNPLGLLEGSYAISRDTSGEIATITDPSSTTLFTKTYDAAGRLTGVTAGTFSSALTYDALGRKATVVHSDGPSAAYTFDNLNRITDITWSGPTAVEVGLTYNTAGNISGITRENGAYTLSYDNINQLVGISSSGTGSFIPYNRTFTYDSVGNRATDSLNGTGSFVANFLTANGVASYLADPDGFGDEAQETSGSIVKTFSYRGDDVLSGMQNGSTSTTYYFDALGRRVAKAINTGSSSFTQSYVYQDRENRVLLGKAGNGATTLYVDGQGTDEHLGEVQGSTVKGYVTDHLGSILNSGPAGTSHSFGLFGEPNGTATVAQSSPAVLYSFAGRELDAESGTSYNRARNYSSNNGRFLSQDPIGYLSEDANYYRYVGNSPARFTDSQGLYFGLDDLVFSAGGAVVGLVGQGAGDLMSGKASAWQDYAGSALGGAAGGEALLYMGPVGAGAVGGLATSASKQYLKIATGAQCHFDFAGAAVDTAIGAATGFIPGARSAGITAGRGSYNSVFKQIVSKARAGQISDVSVGTAAKMFLGRSAETAAIPGAAAAAIATTAPGNEAW